MITPRIAALALILALASVPQVAMAGCPGVLQAKAHYQAGQAHYQAGRYQEAIAEFTKAQGICPTVAMLFNLARSHDRARNTVKGMELYREYLKTETEKGRKRTFATRRLKELETWQKADPFSEPPKMKDLDTKPPVRVKKPEPPKKTPLTGANKPPATKEPPKPIGDAMQVRQPEPLPRWKRPWAWVATGVAVGLVATGSALLATRRVDEWRRNEATGKLESVTDAWWPGAVLAGVGAVASGVGVWLFVRHDAETQGPSSQLKIGFIPTPTGISIEGVF